MRADDAGDAVKPAAGAHADGGFDKDGGGGGHANDAAAFAQMTPAPRKPMPCTMLEAMRVVLVSPVSFGDFDGENGEESCAEAHAEAGAHAGRAFADVAFNADERAE